MLLLWIQWVSLPVWILQLTSFLLFVTLHAWGIQMYFHIWKCLRRKNFTPLTPQMIEMPLKWSPNPWTNCIWRFGVQKTPSLHNYEYSYILEVRKSRFFLLTEASWLSTLSLLENFRLVLTKGKHIPCEGTKPTCLLFCFIPPVF